ncbi:hypothetical protein SFC08_06355 [Lysinibacillus halotolerans]
MIKPDIDQFTLVLQATGVFDFDEWRDWVAKNLISTFLIKSKMHKLFDNFGEADVKLPEGYTIGYSFNNAPFYFVLLIMKHSQKWG